MELLPVATFILLSFLIGATFFTQIVFATIDYTYCKSDLPPQLENNTETSSSRFLVMGRANGKIFYITKPAQDPVDFYTAALQVCDRAGFTIASISLPCEYWVVQNWFLQNYPTTLYAWIGALRLGNKMETRWVDTDSPMDLSQVGFYETNLAGSYFPGGYSPDVYPWDNALCVSRNCAVFTGAHQNPCSQTPTAPNLEYMWRDTREKNRVICQLQTNTYY